METYYEQKERLCASWRTRAKACLSPKGGGVLGETEAGLLYREALTLEVLTRAVQDVEPFDVAAVVANPMAATLAELLIRDHGQKTGLTLFKDAWLHAVWDKMGRKIYDVAPNLAEKLRYTELRGLDCDEVRLPFPILCITVPKTADLHGAHPSLGKVPVTSLTVTEGDAPVEGRRTWQVFAAGASSDGNAFLYEYSLYLDAGRPLLDVVEERRQVILAGLGEDITADERHNQTQLWIDIFNWALNVILYVTLPDAETDKVAANAQYAKLLEQRKTAKGPKQARISKELASLSPNYRIYVGRSIKSMDEDEREGLEKAKATGGGWHIGVRTKVSGHWRQQPHGPRSEQRRRQFIEPFWRGPLGATVINPRRVVV